MDTVNNLLTPAMLTFIPIAVALVQAMKNAGLSNKFAPFAAVVVGIGFAALVGGSITQIVLGGCVIGLSAAGLYSGASTTGSMLLGGKKNKKKK